ncbi:chemotaxis protein CheY [Heyndrickxia sporothermodurans]|nr:chemotaxis protein CheY [Heyndrickxia sporothermodurans]
MAKVLVVDDAKFMRLTLTKMLAKANHVVIGEAENGRQAVEMYRLLKPEIVTMDITMPEMTGLEAVQQITKEFPQAKIIICSSMGQQKMVMSAIEAGAKDYIVKPFNENRVNEAIERVLR